MVRYYYFISHAEETDLSLTAIIFTAGENKRDRKRLTQLKFIANACNDYLSIRDQAAEDFFMQLAESLYHDGPYLSWEHFNRHNVLRMTIEELMRYISKKRAYQGVTKKIEKEQQIAQIILWQEANRKTV